MTNIVAASTVPVGSSQAVHRDDSLANSAAAIVHDAANGSSIQQVGRIM
jgi:hypothetical protein